MSNNVLDGLYRPKNVAVIGASSTPGKIGYTVVENLIQGGFEGKIYPVNPKADEILGLKVYPTIADLPAGVDAAVITVPAKLVPQAVEDCGKHGVKGLIVITSGFSETGQHELEHEIVEIARRYNTRILGPNIVGYLSNTEKLNASFAPFLPLVGKAALISQSGALLIAMDASTYTRRVGFDKLISIGNMSDVDFADTIEWLNDDPATACISLYIEGFKDGRRFMEVSRKSKKPIIALKSGVSAHGAAAAASHTGSLAGAAKVYGAAFQQAGVLQAGDLDNLFDLTLALSLQPPMKGDNLLIITNGGGVGVLATDAAERYGLPLKFAPADVQAELKKHMPEFGSAKNPVDLTGMAGNEWYMDSVRYALPHEWVDGLVVLYCETAMTDPVEIAKGIKQAIDESGCTTKPVTVSFVGGEKSAEAMRWLVENGVPAFGAPDVAVNTMAALREYARMREMVADNSQVEIKADRAAALKIIANARTEGRGSLTEIEAKQVFTLYGLPVTTTILAHSEDEAAALANKVGYPVVMKIVSPEILHKSDAGGVKVNIKDEAAVRDAYRTILANAKAYNASANIHGVAVQEMAPWGTEVILGSVNDATFGPTMMFGLGGIFVEVLKDVTFRVAPVSPAQALRMLGEIRGGPILNGVRGEAPRDKAVLADTICRYANMILDLSDEISESDANPVLVYEEGKGVKVVDARIILKKK
ncbi:acetate--CoA ligase family protein [Levilinea saccharolytica]|uniref:Acetyl-CoA synthetase n=1 Tax=Levilinea saccharolytica TaxID=229921 RepID=A0A0P6YER6_9CHLR|nr:acetate--CoA ligase family protein [Levilinea saccharolytica]KPL83476.1 acetyl-CoA synthetase [Levilinea saccharolytica]GAP18261.1 acyl-CoA synthetase [Levilinea saccharolytica]